QKKGGKLIYDPELIVHRRPRHSLKAFCKMLMTYGRGRAEQFRLHPTPGSALNFVPPVFCLYLALVIVLASVGKLHWVGLVPLGFYAVAVLAQVALLDAGTSQCEQNDSSRPLTPSAAKSLEGGPARSLSDGERERTADE